MFHLINVHVVDLNHLVAHHQTGFESWRTAYHMRDQPSRVQIKPKLVALAVGAIFESSLFVRAELDQVEVVVGLVGGLVDERDGASEVPLS